MNKISIIQEIGGNDCQSGGRFILDSEISHHKDPDLLTQAREK